MKLRAILLISILFFFSFGIFDLPINATEFRNYETSEVTVEDASTFLSNIEFKVSEYCDQNMTIHSFAVSEQGKIALAVQSVTDAYVMVYDSNGIYQYGYQFINRGSAFVVFFESEDVSIIWGKSGYIGSFDAQGNCIKMGKDTFSKSNANAFERDRNRPKTGTVGNLKYYAEGGMWLSYKCTRFTIEDETGEIIVIYDASKEYFMQRVINGILLVSFVSIFFAFRAKSKKEKTA